MECGGRGQGQDSRIGKEGDAREGGATERRSCVAGREQTHKGFIRTSEHVFMEAYARLQLRLRYGSHTKWVVVPGKTAFGIAILSHMAQDIAKS